MNGRARATAGTLAAVLLLAFACAQPASGAAVPSPSQLLWLVKSNDLTALRQQAAADGVKLPAFTWVGCGRPSDTDRCRAGQQPIFTNYWRLRASAKAGWLGTAVFDIEPWRYTPRAERKDPGKWICLAAGLQRTDPLMQVIITPFARPTATRMISEDVEAARCGAYGVDVQSQFANGSPRQFALFVRAAVRAIRKANPNTVILTGLATNNPRVETAAHLAADYHRALAAGVQGFWLNANNWLQQNHCTAADGGAGCPQVGLQFLADIGLVADRGPGQPSGRGKPPEGNGVAGIQPAPGPPTESDFVRLAVDSSITRIARVLTLIAETLGRLAGPQGNHP